MSLSVSPNVNIDTLKSLEANKTYFLSSTTGEVKEASWWMRFKCAIGVQSARQKVANLIDAIRTTLLDAAGKTGGDVTLDTNINSIKRTEMVKGSVIKDIATRFAAANAKTIVKSDASKIAADFAETFATKSQLLKQKDVDAKAIDIIEDINNMGYSLCEALSFGRDKPLDYKSRVEFDIDGGQSEDIRLLVGDMARREIQQD